jgi:hypothetical protein
MEEDREDREDREEWTPRTIELVRYAHTAQGVLGRLNEWYSLENRWLDNRRQVSCIPVGEYELRPARFNRGGYATWEVVDVPGRSNILFHIGNTDKDTHGCILPGMAVGVLSGRLAVLRSREAFGQFMDRLKDQKTARLVVRDLFPVDAPRGSP